MSKPQHILGALLTAQVLLTGGLYLHGRQTEARLSQTSAILSFDKGSVDKIVLTDDKNATVTLVKTGDGWTLPDYQKLPADATRVDGLLTTLSDLKGGWPVSTSADSYEQFQVADSKFAHKIQLFAGDKPAAELLVGTSPALRKAHVRNPKDNNVYAASMASADIMSVNDQWLDRSLLQAKDPTEIKGRDFSLKKAGADWALDGPQASKLNGTNAVSLAQLLTGLRVESVQTTALANPPALTLDIVDGGKPLTYQFWVNGETRTVKRSDNDNSFTLSKPVYESVVGFDLARLTQPEPPKPGAPSGPTGESAPTATPRSPQ